MGPSLNKLPYMPGRPGSRPRAIVAEPDETIRAATCEILRREKFDVTPCKDGSDVLRLCKELVPAIVMLDVSMPGADITQTVRILQRCRDTKPVRLVGICPKEFDELRRKSLMSNGAFALLQRPMKRQDIVTAVNEALASSNEERATLAAATAKRAPRAKIVDSKSPLLVRRILCPFHEEPVAFDRFTLRSGKIVSDVNFYDLPVYTAASAGVDFVNYHALQTMVCPTCLFATGHAGYFKEPLNLAAVGFAFNENVIRGTRDTAADRVAKAGPLDPSFWTPQRSLEQAILAGELSIACSNLLLDANPHTFAIELARMGNARLRNAHLKELLNRPIADIDFEYREALDLFQRAFSSVRGNAIFRIAYQAMAVAIRFREDRVAMQFLSLLNQLERDPAQPKEDRVPLLRYLPRLQRAWEDRDLHRGPGTPIDAAA